MSYGTKFVIVTGASTGIGRAIALALAKEGYLVGLVARSEAGLQKTARLISEAGGKSEIFILDLRDTKAIGSIVDEIKVSWKRVDILVNGAGVWHGEDKVYADTNFEDFSVDEILETYEVGINAPTLLCHGLVSLMPSGSKIVNISGTFESGAKGWLPYYVSKKALEDLTVGLAQEFRDKQIQVNCVSPSDTLTESYSKFFPEYANEKECILPQDIAQLVLYLTSNKADHITGQTIEIKKK